MDSSILKFLLTGYGKSCVSQTEDVLITSK